MRTMAQSRDFGPSWPLGGVRLHERRRRGRGTADTTAAKAAKRSRRARKRYTVVVDGPVRRWGPRTWSTAALLPDDALGPPRRHCRVREPLLQRHPQP